MNDFSENATIRQIYFVLSKTELSRNIFFLLLILHNFRGILYPNGVISVVFSLGIFGMSTWYLIKTILIKNTNGNLYRAIALLFFLNVLGFLLTGNIGNEFHYHLLKSVLFSLLPFFPFFYYSKQGLLNLKFILIFALVMFLISIIRFYLSESILIQEEGEGATNNSAYAVVAFLPFIFLLKRDSIVPIVFLVIIFALVVQSSKRGAIVIAVLCTVVYILYRFSSIHQSKYKIAAYIGLSILVLAILLLLYMIILSNDNAVDRINSIAEGQASNRDIIYLVIGQAWYNSDSIINMIFGFGFAASLRITGDFWGNEGSFAHNDWLELLSNFGLIGILTYIYFFYSLLSLLKKSRYKMSRYYVVLAIILMWFVISIFSMGYLSPSYGYTFLLLLANTAGINQKAEMNK